MERTQEREFISQHALKMMELMQLGKLEKGALSMDGKFKSLAALWFGTKKKEATMVAKGNDDAYIRRDSLITFKCIRGKSESIEYYRVLGIFSKHYNKWFLHWDSDSVLYKKDSKKYKIMAWMVQRDVLKMKEVVLEKDGNWGPKFVYTDRKSVV